MAAPPATGEWSVTSLLPPNEVDLEFEDLHVVMSAQEGA